MIRYDTDQDEYGVQSEQSVTSTDEEEDDDDDDDEESEGSVGVEGSDTSSVSWTEEVQNQPSGERVTVSSSRRKGKTGRAVQRAATARSSSEPSRVTCPSDEEEDALDVVVSGSRLSTGSGASRRTKRQRVSKRVIIDESDSDDDN